MNNLKHKLASFILKPHSMMVLYVTLKYIITSCKYSTSTPKILSTKDTLRLIVQENKSVSRFGDGELNLVTGRGDCGFQKHNQKLKKRLIEVLRSNDEDILICMAPFKLNKKYGFKARFFWKQYWMHNLKYLIIYFRGKTFGSTQVTRAMMFYENNLADIKEIWDNREVVFVYSEKGKFVIDQRLFDNIRGYDEIKIPATNAFDNYEYILEECKEKEKNKLFLIAGGPTATVLAYDLGKLGYQAIDTGHLPNAYSQYLGEIVSPESLPIEKS